MKGIILTAAKAENSIAQIFGEIPSCMVPVNGKPILSYMLNNMIEAGISEVIIAIAFNKEIILEYIDANYNQDKIKIIFEVVNPNLGAGNSLLSCIKGGREDNYFILLGDTIVPNCKEIINDKNTVYTSTKIYESEKWSTVEKNKKNILTNIYEKTSIDNTNEALIGCYILNNCSVLNNFNPIKKNEIIQISTLLKFYLKFEPIFAKNIDNWLDFGHIDNYQTSKKRLLEARSFNSLSFDDKFGTITKRSLNVNKFINEIEWQLNLPKKLKVLTPRIVDYSLNEKKSFITMEYYGYPTLAELWIYSQFNNNIFNNIFKKLLSILDEFKKYSEVVTKQEYENVYITKTQDRIAELCNINKDFDLIFKLKTIKINNKKYNNWNIIKNDIFKLTQKLYNKNDNCLIHGDFCFSNILYDINSGIVRLIDPRGVWGDSENGDIKYDIAKLRHSISGQYDFIVNDNFNANFENNNITYQVLNSDKHKQAVKLFDDLIKEQYNINEIKLIEGILFISMLPFHNNSFKRQIVMFSKAIELFNEILKK